MFRIARVTGFAVASLLVAAATIGAPSRAWEFEATPVVPSYIDHSLAATDAPETGAAAGPDAADAPAFDPNLTTDIAEHAVAPVENESKTIDFPASGTPLAELVSTLATSKVADSELECLAGAVYFESKGEPLQGQLAVAEVIINRTESGKFPRSICGVVKQKSQFSFVRGGRIPPIDRDSAAWRKAVAIAHIATRDLAEVGIGEAMFFHARYVSPGWRRLTRVASIGNHIFYRQ